MKPRPRLVLIAHARNPIPKRHVHYSSSKSSALSTAPPVDMGVPARTVVKQLPALAVLPTSSIVRSYLITRATSSPLLLNVCFAILKRMLDSKSVVLNPDRNPAVRWLFKNTFYAQFCAGENKQEVQKTVDRVKHAGYKGVILEYALEVLDGEDGVAKTTAEEVEIFRKGMLETVHICCPGDFIALKWSGIGKEGLQLLNRNKPPTPAMSKAILEICDLAAKKDAALLPGAELELTNSGIDTWTLDLQKRYNKVKPGKAFMYTTYQAYLRSTPKRIARDLAIAQQEGFTLGVKLVRGAYLLSEPRSAVWSSKEETDKAYDEIVEAIMKRRYNNFLKPANAAASKDFPPVALMIASHNATSVKKAREIRSKQAQQGEERIDCAYAQLQGMADEISCDLVKACKECDATDPQIDTPQPYKCATWGTVSQCLNFLYRRAAENKDAASRTAETRKAMGKELMRRAKESIGLA